MLLPYVLCALLVAFTFIKIARYAEKYPWRATRNTAFFRIYAAIYMFIFSGMHWIVAFLLITLGFIPKPEDLMRLAIAIPVLGLAHTVIAIRLHLRKHP